MYVSLEPKSIYALVIELNPSLEKNALERIVVQKKTWGFINHSKYMIL